MAQVRCSLPSPPSATTAATTELTLVALPVAGTAAHAGPDDDASGPGWFASSWALRRGLEVCEGLPSDVNLDEWLTVFFGRPIHRAATRATASPRSITAIA